MSACAPALAIRCPKMRARRPTKKCQVTPSIRMTPLTRELAAALADELAADPSLAEVLATALAPHLEAREAGWLGPAEATAYLGLNSLDALDRLVAAGLPYSQPGGRRGRRYFRRSELDRWMEAAA